MTTDTRPGWHQIEVSQENYDVLARTAEARGTDINEVLRYLLELPQAPAPRLENDDDE